MISVPVTIVLAPLIAGWYLHTVGGRE